MQGFGRTVSPESGSRIAKHDVPDLLRVPLSDFASECVKTSQKNADIRRWDAYVFRMLKSWILFGMLAVPFALQAQEAPLMVTVVGDRVNLRNAPELESDVISSATYGERLEARQVQENWVEVVPPENLTVWVYSPLLFEDREVKAPVLNTRGGPGTNFPVLGQLKRGDQVEVLEESGDWRKIAVPSAVSLWISRKFVQVPPSVVAVNPTPAPTPVPTAVPDLPLPTPTPQVIVEVQTVEKIVEVPVLPTPTPAVEAPEGVDLVPLGGQGTFSVRKGHVKAYLLAGNSPSRFQLIRIESNGDEVALSYLRGDPEQLSELSGQPVVVRGRDFWVTGKKLPLTRVESIKILEESR